MRNFEFFRYWIGQRSEFQMRTNFGWFQEYAWKWPRGARKAEEFTRWSESFCWEISYAWFWPDVNADLKHWFVNFSLNISHWKFFLWNRKEMVTFLKRWIYFTFQVFIFFFFFFLVMFSPICNSVHCWLNNWLLWMMKIGITFGQCWILHTFCLLNYVENF